MNVILKLSKKCKEEIEQNESLNCTDKQSKEAILEKIITKSI